ncbi:MAG TPA: phosphodiester glycosidase family protein [Pseudonocardiaceae bacterium]|nr:phosphodiester glycosidase family protein [Pseudonocardiaceae bacterium]
MPRSAPSRRRARLLCAVAVSAATVLASAVTATAAPAKSTSDITGAASGNGWLPATPSAWDLVVDKTSTPAFTVTKGVTEHSDTIDAVSGRQHTQVMNVDLTDPNLRLGTVEAGDVLSDPKDETISSMAARTGAVAGINGDYFEINATGRPLGGVISNGVVLKSPRPNYNAQLAIKPDGSMVIGQENFTGTITDETASHALTSINVVNDVPNGITEVTSALGATGNLTGPATLVLGHASGANLVVDSVQTVTSVPALTAPAEGLLGAGAPGAWLAGTVHAGDTLNLADQVGSGGNLNQLLSGATELVKDGAPYTDPTGTPPSGVNPETAVGVTKDGKHAILVTLDGRLGESAAVGVSPAQVAGYLVAQGAYTALLFDGGGSTEMIARQPGAGGTSVMNTPSDGHERPVANGLFIYTNEATAGPATSVVVNGGAPVTTVPGGTIPVPVYATDANANPAAGTTTVQVLPPSLASWSNGQLTVHQAGAGVILARNGHAISVQPLRVVSRLASLSVSPAEPNLNNGATQQFSLTGSTALGQQPAVIANGAATWSVTPANLGTIDANGLFTAAASGSGLVTVSATVGGKTTTASVAVGSDSQVVADLSDVANWSMRNTTGAPATMTLAPGDLPPGITAPGSLRLNYTMPAGSGVKQLVMWDNNDINIGPNPAGQNPTGIGIWVKGDKSGLTLHEQYVQVNGAALPLAETPVTWQGWKLYTAAIPAGTQFPITMDYIDFLAINPSTTITSTLNISGLQALYSPRPVVTPPYVAIPDNPSWLSYNEDESQFSQPGNTILTGDDAHLLASDPGSTSSNVFGVIQNRLNTLPAQAKPNVAQFMGDMSDDGLAPDLAFAQSKMASLGIPYHDAVGNHEISQGAVPENGNFTADFGPTHYAYQAGAAQVIVTDNGHGGLLNSNAYQVPAESQYPWLVNQLSNTTAPAVIVATHMPAYDPHAVADSQFTDRWEARMYLRLIQRYQQTHPAKHVIMLYGHARGFAEQILDPLGNQTDTAHGGIPQLTIADLGMPAYAPSDQGGFYNFGLIHVTPNGQFQFTVEPALASIAVTAPDATLPVGGSERLSALGTQTSGDNLPVVTVPIADPASHVWSSSDPRIVSVDARTGAITARHSGSATISVRSGGVTGSLPISVS